MNRLVRCGGAIRRMLTVSTVLSFLLLLPIAAQAVVYTFSGSSFPSCNNGWSQSGSTWTCGSAISLATGDRISPSGSITVLAKAGITLNGSNTVGSSSVPVNLATEWGDLTANGSGTVIWGNLTAASGKITLNNATVNGTVTTTGGGAGIAFSGGSVTGNVSSGQDITAVGGTTFGGNVTADGDIALTGGSVAGNVNGKNITATNVTFRSNVAAISGKISLTGGSVAGQVSSNCCTVTTNNTNVANGIRSDSNTVTINGGTVTGSIYSSGGHGIEINNATIPGGTIITTTVAINVNNSTLGTPESPVTVSSQNEVKITGSTVYGNVTAASWPGALTVTPTSTVYGVCTSDTNSNVAPGVYNNRCEGVVPVSIAHYAITFPGGSTGVTCEALKVRITAHDANHAPVNPTNGTTITVSATNGGSVTTGGVGGSNSGTFNGSTNSIDFWLTKAAPGTVNVNVSDGTRTESATEDPSVAFVDAAFKIYACSGSVPATCTTASSLQIAGKSSNQAPDAQILYLRAVQKDTDTGACTSALPAGGNPIQFGYECNDPATCTGANLMNVAGAASSDIARNGSGTISASSGSYTDVTLNFDGNGYAPFVLKYLDAGRVTLHARKALGATVGPPPRPAVTVYGAMTVHVRPFAFLVEATSNPGATAFDGTRFRAAGENFEVRVRGVAWEAADDLAGGIYDGRPRDDATLTDNAVTQNFTWNTTLDVLGNSQTPSATDGGRAGTVQRGSSSATLAAADFRVTGSVGTASASDVNYSEVGSFVLLANSTNYLGQTGFDVSGRTVVGRFVPHHFGVTGEVRTRSDLAGASSIFTYMDEPMQVTLTVTAFNQADVETTNYIGNFARLDRQALGTNLTAWTTALGMGAVSGTTNLSSRLRLDSTSTNSAAPVNTTTQNGSTSGWAGGTSFFRFNLVFTRNTAAGGVVPDGPFTALMVGAKPRDADGVTLPTRLSPDTAHCVNLDVNSGNENAGCDPGATEANLRRRVFTTDVRFGRLRLTNAYGSVSPLSVPAETQYWSGRSWVGNRDDSLTSLAAFAASYSQCNLTGAAWPAPTLAASLNSGVASIGVAAPSSGTCLLTLTLSNTPWLQGNWNGDASYGTNPSAKATFGIFSPEQRRTIHIRELY